jgi:hypothetical protein
MQAAVKNRSAASALTHEEIRYTRSSDISLDPRQPKLRHCAVLGNALLSSDAFRFHRRQPRQIIFPKRKQP